MPEKSKIDKSEVSYSYADITRTYTAEIKLENGLNIEKKDMGPSPVPRPIYCLERKK